MQYFCLSNNTGEGNGQLKDKLGICIRVERQTEDIFTFKNGNS